MGTLVTDNIFGLGNTNPIKGSLFFEGKSSYLSMASGEIISGTGFGTNDFTIEFWINQGVNASNYTGIFNLKASTTTDRFQVAFQSSTIQVYTDTSTWRDTGYAPVSGQWEHIAFVRNYSGNTLKMYANGVEKWSVSNNHDYDEAFETFIGLHNTSYGYLEGYISNLRVLNGTALYTTNNFTPPTEKLTIVENTVLLCCQDSDNALQEATGKTITAYGNLDYSLVGNNLITNGNFDTGTVYGWTLASGSRSLGTGQSGTFGDGNHLVLTGGNMYQAFTTKIGRTYFVNAQSNGGDSSYISTSTSTGDAIITDIRSSPQTGKGVRGQKSFVATQTTYYVILSGGGGGGNFDNISVYEAESPKAPKVLPSVGIDEGVTFEGDTKVNSQGYMYFPTGDTSQRGRGRAVIWMGIKNSSHDYTKNIDYIEIQTLGNTTRFGDISDTIGLGAAISSSTRAVMAGGSKPGPGGGNQNFLEYVTIATTGNAKDFGGVSTLFRYGAGISNSTRGLIAGAYQGSGASGTLNVIQYLTIANLGNTVDFGDMIADGGTGVQGMGSCSSSTRGITFGGATPTTINEINYITIGTLGNSVDFGDLSAARYKCQGVSNGTRGVVAGGDNSGAVNIIEYITIAATGNATDFGDLSSASELFGATGGSNKIRGVFVGRGDWPATDNAMSYITIATTGNAKDFGDIGAGLQNYGSTALSDSHGGLS